MSSIHETLSQLDDRLDDLRRQVARLTEEPGGPAGDHPFGHGPDFSVTRLHSGSDSGEPPSRPEAGQEIQELLAACERLLAEARALMGPRVAAEARPAFFEGTVTLVALGAHLIETIQVLEDSLNRAGHVTRAYIRRVHAGEARIELTLTGGVDLVGELNRVMPFPFGVRSVTRQEIVISLEGGGVEL